MITTVLLLILGLIMVIYGADIMVDGASALAKAYNIPNIVIGLTVVAFGTSAPELAISVYSAMTGNTEIAIGNVVGSNICNILLILGITGIIAPLAILRNTVLKEIPFSILAALVIYFMLQDTWLGGGGPNMISTADGFILLGFMSVFMYYLLSLAKNNPDEKAEKINNMPLWRSILFIIIGLILLVFGGKFFVDNASSIAEGFGMSKAIIGVTIVAIGTSLPELATSVVAAMKKNADIAVGNVIGSNVFNVFFVLGVSSVVNPLDRGAISNVDLYSVIGSSVLLFLACFVFARYKITRKEGIIFIASYVGYITYQISLI